MSRHPNPQRKAEARNARRDARWWRNKAADARKAGRHADAAKFERHADKREAEAERLEGEAG